MMECLCFSPWIAKLTNNVLFILGDSELRARHMASFPKYQQTFSADNIARLMRQEHKNYPLETFLELLGNIFRELSCMEVKEGLDEEL